MHGGGGAAEAAIQVAQALVEDVDVEQGDLTRDPREDDGPLRWLDNRKVLSGSGRPHHHRGDGTGVRLGFPRVRT